MNSGLISVDSVSMVPCFLDFINEDIFQNTMAVNEKDNLMCTQRMCAKCLIVLQRQLSDFLVSGIFSGEGGLLRKLKKFS